MKKRGLDASELKYIAILAMLIDHSAFLFVPFGTLLYFCLRFIGRFTIPIMCFFISEGYHHTKNLKKYYARMAVFAVISHFAYSYCFTGGWTGTKLTSVIANLLLCLACVDILNNGKIDKAYKLPLIAIIAFISDRCDWGSTPIVFTLAFELARGDKRKQISAYGLCAVWYCLPMFKSLIRGDFDMVSDNLYKLGLFVPMLLLLIYNGERGGSKATKWVFYIFYPAHLIALGLINTYVV